jgi:superfamily II DNA/RNA helicase
VSGAPEAKHEAILRCFSKTRIVRTMVFCNTIASCRSLGHFLRENGIPNSCLHGDIPQARRADEYRRFITHETEVLVCTDAAARGLDVEGVAHVILFDFPHDATEYLHRVGRTARAGTRGRVTSLVCKRDLALARQLRDATRQHLSLMDAAPRPWRPASSPRRSPVLAKRRLSLGKQRPQQRWK